MKKIVIDGRMVTPVPHGFARYVMRMADGLREVRDAGGGLPYEPVFLVNRKTAPAAFQGFRTIGIESDFLAPRELLEIPRVLRSERAALYHSPTFSSLLGAPCPWVVTVHDLNHLTYGGLKERLYYRWILKQFARKAAALLTVSEFSRREIAAWIKLPEASIRVVPNALGPELFQRPESGRIQAVLARYGLEAGRFFFCVSNPKPHKNVPLLVEAYSAARAAEPGLWPLVLTLHLSRRKGDLRAVEGIREIGGVHDEDTLALLHSAGAVVFPSLYEGFGLPPVEAAAAGVPLIVSKIAPHQEGLQDLGPQEALWVDPRDRGGWSQALQRATAGDVQAPSVDTQGKIRARYGVSAMGRNMDRIYRRVLGVGV